MDYNLQDPDLDFTGRADILARKLREAEADQAYEAAAPRMMGNWVLNTGPVGGIAAAIRQGIGRYNESEANAERELLNKEELRRYDELSRRINEPGTKRIKKVVVPGSPEEGVDPVTEEVDVPLDLSDPNDLAADNARRMGIAAEMHKLPLARKVAQDYLVKGANFPEALALLRTKQIEQAQQQEATRAHQTSLARERIDASNERAAEGRALTGAIAAGNLGIQQGRLDDARAREQEKRDEAAKKKRDAVEASISALAPIEASLTGLLTKPDAKGKRGITPELEAYTGNIDQYMPDPLLRQGTVDAGKKLQALKDQVTMINLAAAKAAVGQSFGSMQVKEWDKFVNTLASLDRAQGPKQLAESLNYIDNYIRTHKAELQKALTAGGGGGAPTAPVGGGQFPPVGTKRELGGKTYTHIGEGQWAEQ